MTATLTRAALLEAALAPGLLPGEQRALDQDHEEIGDGTDNCGGWGWAGPPCGGCTSCSHAQASHYAYERAERRRRMASAGLLVAVQRLPLPWTYPTPGDEPRACATWQRPRP